MIKKTLSTLLILLFLAGTAWAEININTADQEALDSLAGIGPVKAQAIIDYRSENGEYSNVNQLLEVKGIGPKTLGEIEDEVTVGE